MSAGDVKGASCGAASSRSPPRSSSCAGRWCASTAPIRRATPPAMVEAVEGVLDATSGSRASPRGRPGRPAVNLVARVRGAGPGRRLVLNGHLDTFPVGEARWTHPPLGADLEDGRIYGRGACDMKAGVAALVLAFVTLAEFREAWRW